MAAKLFPPLVVELVYPFERLPDGASSGTRPRHGRRRTDNSRSAADGRRSRRFFFFDTTPETPIAEDSLFSRLRSCFCGRCLCRFLAFVVSISIRGARLLAVGLETVPSGARHLRTGDFRRARRRRLDGAPCGARRRAQAHRGGVPGAPRRQRRCVFQSKRNVFLFLRGLKVGFLVARAGNDRRDSMRSCLSE